MSWHRRHSGAGSRTLGFTLVEVLVALAITGGLLAGLGMVITQLRTGREAMRTPGNGARFRRALSLIEQDVRGMITMVELPAEHDVHGEPVAAFRSTWRIDALLEDRWAGSATVVYWLDHSGDTGVLWRSESAAIADEEPGWTPLVDGVESVAFEFLGDEDGWQPWPQSQEDQSNQPGQQPRSLRMSIRRLGADSTEPRVVLLPTMLLDTEAHSGALWNRGNP